MSGTGPDGPRRRGISVSTLEVGIVLPASPGRVWDDIRDIGSHVAWMDDATNIRFMSGRHEGVGTRFETDTRVGPFRLTDVMEITEWEPGQVMGIRHVGVVTGTGRFTLAPAGDDHHTTFTWRETLRFPWWMGGPAGAMAARPVLRWVWRRNLSHLRRRFDDPD